MGNVQGGNKSSKTLEHLILMGDNVLDDFYGCNDQKNDVEHQLITKFENEVSIVNFALEETTIFDLLNGKKPHDKYINARKKLSLDPYQTDPKDGKFYPLKLLTSRIQSEQIYVPPSKEDLAEKSFMRGKSPRASSKNAKANDGKHDSSNSKQKKDYKSIMRPIVVLSVGGKDLINNLSYGQYDLIIAALEEQKFKENLDKIVKFLTKNLNLDVILVLCYEPEESFFDSQLHFSRDDLVLLMEWFAKQLFRLGESYGLPILDLSRTMNPFEKTHYGGTPIQASNKGGQFIVDLIHYILHNYDFDNQNRKSMIYYGITTNANGIVSELCDKSARSGYLRAVNKINTNDKMGGTEMDLLNDLFSEPTDSKETDNEADKTTNKRKRSLFGRNKQSNDNETNKNDNNVSKNGNRIIINDDDMLLDQMINEQELTENMKFFSSNKDDSNDINSAFGAETRARDKHSLFDTENDQKLNAYSVNDTTNTNDSTTAAVTSDTTQNNDNTATNEINSDNNNNNTNNSDDINGTSEAMADNTEVHMSRDRAVANDATSIDNTRNRQVAEVEIVPDAAMGTRTRMGYDASN